MLSNLSINSNPRNLTTGRVSPRDGGGNGVANCECSIGRNPDQQGRDPARRTENPAASQPSRTGSRSPALGVGGGLQICAAADTMRQIKANSTKADEQRSSTRSNLILINEL